MGVSLRELIIKTFKSKTERAVMLRIAGLAHEEVATFEALQALVDYAPGQSIYVASDDVELRFQDDEPGEDLEPNVDNTGTGAVSVTGIPADPEAYLYVEITSSSGVETPAEFRWSLDGGDTWEEEGVTAADEVELGDSGFTLLFEDGGEGTGLFVEDDVWDMELNSYDTIRPNNKAVEDPGRWVFEKADPIDLRISSGSVGVDGAAGYGGYTPGASMFLFPMFVADRNYALQEAEVVLSLGDQGVYQGTNDGSVFVGMYKGNSEGLEALTSFTSITGSNPLFRLSVLPDATIAEGEAAFLFVSAGDTTHFYGNCFARLNRA